MKGSFMSSIDSTHSLGVDELCRIMEDSSDKQALHRAGGVSGIARSLQTDLEEGAEPSSIGLRLSKFGTNVLPDRRIPTFFEMFVEALKDDTLIILIICAIASLILEMIFASPEERATAWVDGTAILAAVAIVSFVQAYSNHNQEQQFAAVNHIKSIFNVTVKRGGRICQIQNTELVVGDVVHLEQGDCVPADGLLIRGEDLQINQSTASGESEAVLKNENDPFLISNTHVTEGRGTMIVLCVGLKSHQGAIFSTIEESDENQQTPLQEKLEVLAQQIGYMGMIAAGLTFAALAIQWIWRNSRDGWHWNCLNDLLTYAVIALTIIVVAVPEGLPLAVTISLAFSMRQMMDDNNFVRRLKACETMGSATIICTDKTGTLTLNEMNVEHIIIDNNVLDQSQFSKSAPDTSVLVRSIALNTHAHLDPEIGSQTELALLRFLKSQHVDYSSLRKSGQICHNFQFDRVRKLESVVEQIPTGYQTFTKGAIDALLPLCSHYINMKGEKIPINSAFSSQLTQNIERECSKSYRLLGVATKATSSLPKKAEECETDLTLLATFSIRDSLRPNSAKSIADCMRAGIRVVMVTGDHLLTAQAIAHDCNILSNDSICLTGQQLRSMSSGQLASQLSKLAVVARSTPMDKHHLVKAFQAQGHVVGVTGDGTNDVAAFIAADVGLSMGKSGTELAKEASDIVILDDDFGSIVRSVVWGRSVYNNIRRFLQFQLTANVVSLFISFISAVFIGETPFKAVQLLWVNLIMDSLGALALATGKPQDELLDQLPQRRDASLISPFMISNIACQSILQILVILYILTWPGEGMVKGSMYHYTYLFTVFVLCQMFNLVNARAVESTDRVTRGMFDNFLYFTIFAGIGFVQFLLVEVAGHWFSCEPMSLRDWIKAILCSSLSLVVGLIHRKFPRKSTAASRRRQSLDQVQRV